MPSVCVTVAVAVIVTIVIAKQRLISLMQMATLNIYMMCLSSVRRVLRLLLCYMRCAYVYCCCWCRGCYCCCYLYYLLSFLPSVYFAYSFIITTWFMATANRKFSGIKCCLFNWCNMNIEHIRNTRMECARFFHMYISLILDVQCENKNNHWILSIVHEPENISLFIWPCTVHDLILFDTDNIHSILSLLLCSNHSYLWTITWSY